MKTGAVAGWVAGVGCLAVVGIVAWHRVEGPPAGSVRPSEARREPASPADVPHVPDPQGSSPASDSGTAANLSRPDAMSAREPSGPVASRALPTPKPARRGRRAAPDPAAPNAPGAPDPTTGEPPLARAALSFVGMDPEAEAMWIASINDPNVPADARQNLIEDLNEDGFADPKHITPDDIPLILNRMQMIEEAAPDALDEVNANAFEEAYKDLAEMLSKSGQWR